MVSQPVQTGVAPYPGAVLEEVNKSPTYNNKTALTPIKGGATANQESLISTGISGLDKFNMSNRESAEVAPFAIIDGKLQRVL